MLSREDIASAAKRLYSAVMSDTLDALGHRDRAMAPGIRPLDDALVMLGRARTGLYMEVDDVVPGANPYAIEMALIDDLAPGEVAVLGCGGSQRIAPWGELLTTASIARGAVGCVTDGFVRDTRAIRALRFPVFHGGVAPLDSQGRGEMVAMDRPVRCGGVTVRPGELVLGDADGLVVIPREREEEALTAALAKIESEDRTRDELRAGASLASVFEKYGVL